MSLLERASLVYCSTYIIRYGFSKNHYYLTLTPHVGATTPGPHTRHNRTPRQRARSPIQLHASALHRSLLTTTTTTTKPIATNMQLTVAPESSAALRADGTIRCLLDMRYPLPVAAVLGRDCLCPSIGRGACPRCPCTTWTTPSSAFTRHSYRRSHIDR